MMRVMTEKLALRMKFEARRQTVEPAKNTIGCLSEELMVRRGEVRGFALEKLLEGP